MRGEITGRFSEKCLSLRFLCSGSIGELIVVAVGSCICGWKPEAPLFTLRWLVLLTLT